METLAQVEAVAAIPTRTPLAPRSLTLDFLAWIGGEPRTYNETMDAWRTSCPRFPVWEDAVAAGLVELRKGAGGGHGSKVVALTARGKTVLSEGA